MGMDRTIERGLISGRLKSAWLSYSVKISPLVPEAHVSAGEPRRQAPSPGTCAYPPDHLRKWRTYIAGSERLTQPSRGDAKDETCECNF
jgi:hypothetical protein